MFMHLCSQSSCSVFSSNYITTTGGRVNENGTGPIEASPPPLPPSLPPGGDWWTSTPLDRLTSLPVARQLFSPSANWQLRPLVWGWTSLSSPPMSLHLVSFSRSLFSTPLSFSACRACHRRKSVMLIVKPTKHDQESGATLKMCKARKW